MTAAAAAGYGIVLRIVIIELSLSWRSVVPRVDVGGHNVP
ncbi:MAG: putative ABC-type ATPase, partial [Thermoproteota archaeon]